MTTDFLGKQHNHNLVVWTPKDDKARKRIETAFLEQSEKLRIMVDGIHTIAPVMNFDLQIVGIASCKACAQEFVTMLEDSLNITRDLVDMLDKADKSEIQVHEGKK